MTHGSLFSGIDGFDLAAEWMGWDNVAHVEIRFANVNYNNYL
jgi:DNA (cytosine-5)-methyltransferase 1